MKDSKSRVGKVKDDAKKQSKKTWYMAFEPITEDYCELLDLPKDTMQIVSLEEARTKPNIPVTVVKANSYASALAQSVKYCRKLTRKANNMDESTPVVVIISQTKKLYED